MLKIKILFVSAIVLIAAISTYAGNDLESQLKDYFNKTAQKVIHTPDPAEKRSILNESFDRLLKAFNSVTESPLSDKDRAGVDYFSKIIQEKKNELNGSNGYSKIPDASLDQFAMFSMQQFEQSAQYVTISIVTLLLIIILVVLLVKP
jgi:hypothetical protein